MKPRSIVMDFKYFCLYRFTGISYLFYACNIFVFTFYALHRSQSFEGKKKKINKRKERNTSGKS